jgi:transposase
VGPGTTSSRRSFQFVPLWGLAVFFMYRMRRVDCPRCGVTVERVPWARGKEQSTEAFMWYLTFWSKLLAWQRVAEVFQVSWGTVYAAVEHAVEWGLARRRLEGMEAIGVDEIQWQRGHHYLTPVYQIDEGCKRLLYIAQDRTKESLRGRHHAGRCLTFNGASFPVRFLGHSVLLRLAPIRCVTRGGRSPACSARAAATSAPSSSVTRSC